MSKKDLKKLHGMQQQAIFYNPIFRVGEIVRAYPVNKKYSLNLTPLFAVLKVVTPLWLALGGIRQYYERLTDKSTSKRCVIST